jgi:hypothetical protein
MLIRTAHALCLGSVLLADAGVGSCGTSHPRLVFSVSDCSCLPASLDVQISGESGTRIELKCGQSATVPVSGAGARQVVVTQGTVVWFDDRVNTFDGDVPVAMSCPHR